MKVISGNFKGLKLNEPKSELIRPTTEKVKEAIFDVIQFDITGKVFLDLFSGSGQIGVEALSRGASFVVFVDASVKAVSVIKKNVSKINSSKNFSIVNKTAMNFLENNKQLFDIAFMDPPYNKNILPDLILEISKIINPGGIVICEHESSTVLPKNTKNLNFTKTKHYGTISVTFYNRFT